MAFTQTQIDALEAAMVSGRRSVEYDGRKVEYRSLEEMQKALALMKESLGQTTKLPRRVVMEHHKGLD